MTTYNIDFTDPTKDPIQVPETGLNEDLSIKFPGRIRLEWGKDVNENLLRMLENFACPATDADESVPDLAYHEGILSNPVDGQLWYNTTNERIYKYLETEDQWYPLANKNQAYAANWGQVLHGEQLPRPVSPDGYVFPYDECIWSVSPHNYLDGFTSVRCFSFPVDSTVVMQYRAKQSGDVVDGIANYLIVGIRENDNLGVVIPPPPLAGNTTPTPTPTPGLSPTPTPTPGLSSPAIYLLYDYSSNQALLPLEATAQIKTEELVVSGGNISYETDVSTTQNFNALVSDSTYSSSLSDSELSASLPVEANINKSSSRILFDAGPGLTSFKVEPPVRQRTHAFLTFTGLPLDSYSTLVIEGVSFVRGSGSTPDHFISVAIGKDLTTVDQTSGSAGLILPIDAASGVYDEQPLSEFAVQNFTFTIPPSIDRVNDDVTITFSHAHLQDFQMFIDGDIYLST